MQRRHHRGHHSVEGSVKDTVESILVAFILAFIFRAFVVEAFVIPTGSMAPTLLGAHMRFRCYDCGYRFPVNFSGPETQGNEITIRATAGENRTYQVSCPNCGYRFPGDSPEDPDNAATNPPLHYGDRILVLKYLYLFEQPHRWDVVVFKSPHDHLTQDYSQNYIKRLVGLPGESVMILDGNIYISRDKSGNPPLDSFEVQTKPRHVQESLWRIVYDNDYHPRGLPRNDRDVGGKRLQSFRHPWVPIDPAAPGWSIGDGQPGQRHFTFDNSSASAELAFDPYANPHAFSLTDWLAYNANEAGPWPQGQSPNTINDVKLSFVYHRRSGDGPFRAQITTFQPHASYEQSPNPRMESSRADDPTRRVDHVFEARIADEHVTLLVDNKHVGEAVKLARPNDPIHVELINCDYRASVYIDGEEVLSSSPADLRPDIARLLEAFENRQVTPPAKVKLVGDRQNCVVSHVSLWRDIYYLNRGERGSDFERRPQWGSPADRPQNLAHLDQDQFFVLGDNSAVSLDARYWNDPIVLPKEELNVKAGVVPRRFMLGKAFFVYWPAGYRPMGLPVSLVPNFGEMRFIH
jgi:signal peptidase I